MTRRFTNSQSNQPRSLAGCLAIATPQLDESTFRRAVVLVIQHNEQGAFGVVLNRPPNDKVKRAWRSIAGNRGGSGEHISLGGPVNGPVFALHESRSLGEQKVQCGLFFSTSKRNLRKLAGQSESSYRVFFGAAGWRLGQLEQEIDDGAWVICPATSGTVFAEADTQWELALRYYGRWVWHELGIQHFPESPIDN